ncbi:unnamed protein product [Clonostachys rosea]|uniref:Heterokaryon incompatibility domain-containing protein n=1 Tax=Bionectria ochroleuca TaxID=29856 RepID=A0ABY6UGE7_BIOOC|nr:unnamed protein product [Clonostachys rosea]
MAAHIYINLQGKGFPLLISTTALTHLGTVYRCAKRSVEDDRMLELYSNTLKDTVIESTLETIYSLFAGQWQQQEDIVDPFVDTRGKLINTVWVFDLNNDILRFHKQDQYKLVSLRLLRRGPIAICDFELYRPPTQRQGFLPPSRASQCVMRRDGICKDRLERHKALVHKILADFAFQWRHVLSGQFSHSTFRRLAYAIVKIATLDFQVEEITTKRQGTGGFLVWLNNLPQWEPFDGHIVRVGGVSLVLAQHPCHAVHLIRQDFQQYRVSKPEDGMPMLKQRTYLILSVRDVVLYRINSENERCTKSERLFDGALPPSGAAVDLLLEATLSVTPANTLRELPTELQENIVDSLATDPVERARMRCIFDLGLPFTWRSGGRNIEREEGRRNRTSSSPVESHIYFGKGFRGVAYK